SAWSDTFLSPPALTYQRDTLVDIHLQWFEPELNPTYSSESLKRHQTGVLKLGRHFLNLNLTRTSTTTDWASTIPFGSLPFSAQRLALFLRALIKSPDLVVLDEAFSGMDLDLRDKCMFFLTWGTTKTYQYYKSDETRYSRPLKRTIDTPPVGGVLAEGMHVPGLSQEQALIVVSHVKEEVPGLVRDWIRLPEAGTGSRARFGRFPGPLDTLEEGVWEEGIWGSSSSVG
ncbi:MAG: hypothetical protein Q9200_004132, partial [Gallowayella weberi]